jgi:RNA polymerase sigma-70 factor, ECF subfamily
MSLFRHHSINEQTDEQVYQAMANGNPAAFEILYERYKKRILYYFYRMLGNNEPLAQDLLHDIFCKIIQNPSLFDTNRKFSTWIFSVAHNMCKNEYRTRAIRQFEMDDHSLEGLVDETVQIDEEETQQLVNKIFSLLSDFEESHRTAFLLKYREGLQIDEIADILDLPRGTVKSRLHYTRQRLQKLLIQQRQSICDR